MHHATASFVCPFIPHQEKSQCVARAADTQSKLRRLSSGSAALWFPPVLYWRKLRMQLQGLVHLAPEVASIAACKLLGEPCCSRRSSRMIPIKCRAHGFNMILSMPARYRLWQRIIIRIMNFKMRALHCFYCFTRARICGGCYENCL
jgi:hypothetical protein